MEWTIPAFAFLAKASTHLPTPEGLKAELALGQTHSPCEYMGMAEHMAHGPCVRSCVRQEGNDIWVIEYLHWWHFLQSWTLIYPKNKNSTDLLADTRSASTVLLRLKPHIINHFHKHILQLKQFQSHIQRLSATSYMYGILQGGPSTLPFLTVCNCCIWWSRIAFNISKYSALIKSRNDILIVAIFKYSVHKFREIIHKKCQLISAWRSITVHNLHKIDNQCQQQSKSKVLPEPHGVTGRCSSAFL